MKFQTAKVAVREFFIPSTKHELTSCLLYCRHMDFRIIPVYSWCVKSCLQTRLYNMQYILPANSVSPVLRNPKYGIQPFRHCVILRLPNKLMFTVC